MTFSSFVRSTRTSASILFMMALMMAANILNAQATNDTTERNAATDIHYHKFQPAVAPDAGAASGAATSQAERDALVSQQIASFIQEKAARTPAQRKIDSNVLFTIRMMRGQSPVPGIPSLYTGVDLDENNNVAVDIVAKITDSLLSQLTAAGARVLYSNASLHSMRALVPPNKLEDIAASPDVIFISPKQDRILQGGKPAAPRSAVPRASLAPGFAERAAKVRRQLPSQLATQSTVGTPVMGQGSVETEGDLTHRAVDARGTFGVNGAGLSIGVLSDGVTSSALSQATGDLPATCPATPTCLTVLSGQAGAGDEGTAIMEIIHDMAPGANLFFATADNSIASFAQNIRDLRFTYHCDIIVDDVFYFVESPFQDGQTSAVVSTSQGGVVTQAVNDVVADGALYFSSAGNEGNLDSSTSGTFEGDFVPQAAAPTLPTGNVHNFGGGIGYDTITSPGTQVVGLFWADPLGASNNDYDLYLLNSTGTSILGASTNIQNGTQDPVELIGSANVIDNNRLVVFQNTGAANRYFHLGLFRGLLAVATSGETHGHSAASGAYTVAATPAAVPADPAHTHTGPYPGPFTAANQIETFSSDGLRHIFFNGDSTAITPGNLSSTGGAVLNKPDITAADGVSVTGVGGFGSPFYGTSAAAPSAAGVAALVKSAAPTATAAQIRTALTSTAVDIMGSGFDRDSGGGIVMAWEAINSLGATGFADPELGTITATENPGNGNGIIEAGEGALLVIALNNTSGVNAATAITAALTSSTSGVIIMQPNTSSYADIPAGTSGGNNLSPFTFTLASNIPCGQLLNFTLTVDYTGGPVRALNFTVQSGLLTITNTLGTLPVAPAGITTATGTQVNRISRNGVISSCGTPKAFPGAITGSHTFDSYTFTACQAFCMTADLNAGSAGVNLFESAYTPSYVPTSIGTNYAGDAGLSSNIQSFAVATTAGTDYTLVVNDVAGNPLPPPAPANTYTIQIPLCALDCNVNQLPVAVAHDVTVTAATIGGSANANINNGSSDPEGGALTLTQFPPGPYPQGATTVILTATDPLGAASQATATVTVNEPLIPSADLAANTLTFPAQLVNASSMAQNATVTNNGYAALHFSAAPSILGTNASDFAITSGTTCATAAPVADLGTCVVSVTFTPSGAGTRTATLTLTDDATPTTQTVTLTGTGNDFTVSGPATAVSIASGQTATFPITVTAGAGGFPQTVTFTQSGAPTLGTTISFNPTSGSPGTTSVATTLTIATTSRTSLSSVYVVPGQPSPRGLLPVLLWALAACVMLATLRLMRKAEHRLRVILAGLSVVILLVVLGIAGCNSNSSSSSNPNGTPAATSTITVTATSGTLSHTTTVTLTVQ
ncbi:MAG: S8 family serine peptidase [Candidatus Acidiferrales bacterium]